LSFDSKALIFAAMPVKLLIYEDNSRLRQSLELLLGEGSGFEVLLFPIAMMWRNK
jgi:hypothetical protein